MEVSVGLPLTCVLLVLLLLNGLVESEGIDETALRDGGVDYCAENERSAGVVKEGYFRHVGPRGVMVEEVSVLALIRVEGVVDEACLVSVCAIHLETDHSEPCTSRRLPVLTAIAVLTPAGRS